MSKKVKNLLSFLKKHWRNSGIYKTLFYHKKESAIRDAEEDKEFLKEYKEEIHPELREQYKKKFFQDQKDYEWGRAMKISLGAGIISGLISGGIITLIQFFIFHSKE